MTLNMERVNPRLAVSREAGQFLTNTESKGTDHRPDQFKTYKGTCSAPIPLPNPPSIPTVPQYWETNSRIGWKKRGQGCLLQMALKEDHIDSTPWVSGGGSGWSVTLADCQIHPGFYCIEVWENGIRMGSCLPTCMPPTVGKDVQIRLGAALDVGRGRLAFIDVNSWKIVHKFHVTFHKPPYPLFGVWPNPGYTISMQLISGEEISITDRKKAVIKDALFS